MASTMKMTEVETRHLRDAIDEDERLANRERNLPKSETHVFVMPHIENGVVIIGDLWDCRRSQPTYLNLLNTTIFTSEMLQASPIGKCNMRYKQIRSHEDNIQSLHIDGKMSLELLLGMIKLEGSLAYENSTSAERSVDGILYNYLNEQYRIQLKPRIKPELLNKDVEDMLHKGTIEATHVVGGMIIGAEVTALIEVTDTSSKKKVRIDGKGSLDMTKGVLKCLSSFSASAGVKNSDETNLTNYEVKLSVTARPAVEQSPTSLPEFLKFIQHRSEDLKKHINFSFISSNIFGVPIRFILYPIAQFVDLKMEMLYRELTDACQNEFIGVIAKCNDLGQAGCIWKIILNRNCHLRFLQDSKSEFSKKVDLYEKEIIKFAQDVLSRSRKALSVYKRGESELDIIESIVREFNESDATSVQEKAKSMADEGTRELQSAYFDAADENGFQLRVERFTDRNDCDNWLGKMHPRLLLEIKHPCSEAIVKNFLEAAEYLMKLKVDVAIAMPSISNGVFMTLKCNEGQVRREEPELSRALKVLNAIVVEGDSSIHTFYKILASQCSIRIPLRQDDTIYLDKILQMLLSETFGQTLDRDVCFARSICDLATELAVSIDRLVICFPLGAPDTDLAVIKQFRSLAKQDALSKFNPKWIFCNFEVSSYQESPLFLILFQSEIVAVCLDSLDVLILLYIINSKPDVSRINFDTLQPTPTRFVNTLYPERAHYTIEIMNRINSGLTLSCSKISGLQNESHEEAIHQLMTVIRATLHNDTVDLASAVASAVTSTFPGLSRRLETIGWREMNKRFDSVQFKREDDAHNALVGELDQWMNDRAFETMVRETQQQLVELQNVSKDDSDRSLNDALSRTTNDDHCPSLVKEQLSKLKSSRQSLKAKCTQASIILNVGTLKEIVEVGCGHIKALITVLQKNSQKELLPETIGGELAHIYSRRSTTIIDNSVLENELTRFHIPYLPYHMLNALHPVKHGQALMNLYRALGNLDSLDNSDAVAEIMSTAFDELDQANREVLWKNEQWLFLVRHCLKNHNSKILNDSLSKWVTDSSRTGSIPYDIVVLRQSLTAKTEVASGIQTVKISDDIIGHEYSFQACGEMYHIALGENLRRDDLRGKLTRQFAEHLLAEKAIELINGDSRKIPLAFFLSICRNISRSRPGMRVFVMTLLELRMSQKASLLSALFSCKFASSVERHSIRSLFMRMKFLDKHIRRAYGYDAVIVLNTESLRSREMITSYTKGRVDESRDWLSTIFAISLSNLAVVDEALRKSQPMGFERLIKDLDGLRQIGILPEVLISRTFSENMTSIRGASEIIRTQLGEVNSNDDKSVVGASHSNIEPDNDGINYLNVSSSSNNEIDEITSTFETVHEDVTNLYKSLLSRNSSREQRVTFEYWSQLLCSQWKCLDEQQHWLRLREARDLFELAYFGQKFAVAKELLTRTFLIHKNTILKQFMKGNLKETSAYEKCQELETVPTHCRSNCESCQEVVVCREKLYLEVKDTSYQDSIRISFQNHRKSVFESIKQLAEMEITEFRNRRSIAHNLYKQILNELKNIYSKYPHGNFTDHDVEVHVRNIHTQMLASSTEVEHEPSEEDQFVAVVDELFPTLVNSGGIVYDLLMADFRNVLYVSVIEFADSDLHRYVLEDDMTPMTTHKMVRILTQCLAFATNIQEQTTVLRQSNFNSLHIFKLANEINHVISKFLIKKRFDCFQGGIKFESLMASEFNDHIFATLKRFEAKFKLSVSDELEVLLQIYILKIFFDGVIALYKKWKSKNISLSIMSHAEADYKAHISTRLKGGFSNEAEGKLAAMYLVKLIGQMAAKREYDSTISSFLSIPWAANSETVRLRYFEKLALEVSAGRKEAALEHFRNPKASITKWYKVAANGHRIANAKKLFSTSLNKCLQEIRGCKDYSDIDDVLRRYETVASSSFRYERFETKGDEFEPMLNSLISKLTKYSNSTELETIPDIWENSEIRFRLGCTEECFRCGALCWSYLGHTDDKGELSKHYSCHQARGLATTLPGGNVVELLPTPCSHVYCGNVLELLPTPYSHVISLGRVTDEVTLSEYREDHSSTSMRNFSWKEIETDHLCDWKFQKLVPSKYDNLMRWFFQELHADIARSKNLRSPSESKLKEFGYWNLKLPNILAALRNETN